MPGSPALDGADGCRATDPRGVTRIRGAASTSAPTSTRHDIPAPCPSPTRTRSDP
ncbi:hypothetical protein ACFYOV_17110 [Streptomyces sp. NPDC005931]|uniref:hypothetical protein n=1 Tax=Streptomyces sp. NPDC005931 TaxID=3364737 RepID=UPI0036AA1FDA